MNLTSALKRVIPKWIILISDLLIVIWSFTFSYFIVYRFEFVDILRGYFFIYTGLYCMIAFIVMFIMHIHTGFLRYSNMTDLVRVFGSVLLSSVIYLICVNLWLMPGNETTINFIVMVNVSISSMTLFIFRFAVKGLFVFIKNDSGAKKTRVLIYGSDAEALFIKHGLQRSVQAKFTIIGFIDDDYGKKNLELQGTKVYDLKSLEKLKRKYNVEKLIILNQDLDEKSKKIAIEKCLAFGIQVLTIPPTDQWLFGKLNFNQIKNLKIEDLLQRKPIQVELDHISRDLLGKRILITGAAGSIGSEIVNQVIRYKPSMVILCDQAETPLHYLSLQVAETFPNVVANIFIADVTNYDRMSKLFLDYRPEIIFHAAAYKHVPMMEENPTEAVHNNVLGTKNVADLAVSFDCEKFVMISTDKAVNPTNIMGASKRIAEIYIQSIKRIPGNNQVKTRFITTRFGNVLGSNGSVVPRFAEQIEKGGPLTVTHPEITRYFMTIPEAVQLVLEAATIGKGGEIFIFDMGEPVKIADLARNMIKLAGLQPDKDIKIVYTGLRPGEKLYEELLNDGESTLPTYHEKIRISKVITNNYNDVLIDIKELIALNNRNDILGVVKKMKSIVPEYISNNSTFGELDGAPCDNILSGLQASLDPPKRKTVRSA
ncbi:UDP-N-acetyl-alpha-D-glucosamine C6 dehydratase [Mucilaginibacter gotjawali]|uniref:UDP-N-acetyl-alpha-D-glucosamine C6 dehydratase n=3 Tax=Mucilaginibacter gotjawali TaxID=1550579 RepID=A0A0X8X391_9SPHI|nr:UDP-N-acetyl-alpha-D-glucosamine C6 dehydratase [Mucilaginibacter gotjawali]